MLQLLSRSIFDGNLPIEKIDDFKDAVLAAADSAQDGDIVLLSRHAPPLINSRILWNAENTLNR